MKNLWHISAPPSQPGGLLPSTVRTDVCIVGGGFTGCSAAYHLAARGVSVTLIEANILGHGCSGRNSGNLNPGLWLQPSQVEKALGPHFGQRLNELLRPGPEYVQQLVKRHAIECQLNTSGTLHCAHSQSGLKELRQRLEGHLEQGYEAELLDARETALRIGTDVFYGSLLNKSAAWIQPLAYLRGLAAAAVSAGAAIYENCAAQSVVRKNNTWSTRTATGEVESDALLIATNAYHSGMAFGSNARFAPLWYFNLATDPLDAHRFSSLLPNREGCWDTAPVMTSFTRDERGRLVLGSVGRLDGPGGRAHLAWARRRIGQLFPDLAGVPLTFSWNGSIAMTRDHLPHLVDLGPKALGIYGYNGRGIATGTLFGRVLADYALSGDADALPLPLSHAKPARIFNLQSAYYELGATAYHMVSGWSRKVAPHTASRAFH